MFWHYTKLFYSFHWICIMAKVSKNMPQFKRSRFLFLCLNEWPKFRNDLTITKWIPLLLEVVSTQSPHHPYPWAGVDGLCGHSESLAWENFILMAYYPAHCFNYVHCIIMQTVMLSQMKQRTEWGMGRRDCSNLALPQKNSFMNPWP